MRVTSKNIIKNKNKQPEQTKNAQMAIPGQYSVSILLVANGQLKDLDLNANFNIVAYPGNEKEIQEEMFSFQNKIQAFEKEYSLFTTEFEKGNHTVNKMIQAYHTAETLDIELYNELLLYKQNLDSLNILIYGNSSISKRNGNQSPALNDRYQLVKYSTYGYSGKPTKTAKEQFLIVEQLYKTYKSYFEKIENNKLKPLIEKLNNIGAVYFTE